ncbi:MAG: GNAT family N-acetyltransferase [Candidatus Lokiarchaeota archaeon]|nr:GNAT family N-acetyltransferase [Candidatus Lokiarchaeota archaeon]
MVNFLFFSIFFNYDELMDLINGNKIIFREFNEKDQDKIIKLYQEITKEYFPDMNFELKDTNEYIEDLFDINAHYYKEGGKFWVIEIDNELIGMGGVKILKYNEAELKKFRISKNFRRLGLGRKILEEAEKVCKELKIIRIKLDTTDRFKEALKMYEKYGYKIFEKKNMNLWGAKFTQFFLHKSL